MPTTQQERQEMDRLIIKSMNMPSYITELFPEEKGYSGQEENPLLVDSPPPPRRALTRTRRFLDLEAQEEIEEEEEINEDIRKMEKYICATCKKTKIGHPPKVLGTTIFLCSNECEMIYSQGEKPFPHSCDFCKKGYDSIIDLFHNTFLGQDHSFCDDGCFTGYKEDLIAKEMLFTCDHCCAWIEKAKAAKTTNDQGDIAYYCSKECLEEEEKEEEELEEGEELEPEACLYCGEELEEEEEIEEFCSKECNKNYHKRNSSKKRKAEECLGEISKILKKYGF
jgi:hypothetical protein